MQKNVGGLWTVTHKELYCFVYEHRKMATAYCSEGCNSLGACSLSWNMVFACWHSISNKDLCSINTAFHTFLWIWFCVWIFSSKQRLYLRAGKASKRNIHCKYFSDPQRVWLGAGLLTGWSLYILRSLKVDWIVYVAVDFWSRAPVLEKNNIITTSI